MTRSPRRVRTAPIPLRSIFFVFFRVGLLAFGGGFAMLPILRHELHDRRGWLSDEDLTEIVSVSTAFPGAVAVNTALLQGMRMRGVPGAAVAITGITTAPILVILLIAAFLMQFSTVPIVLAFLRGAGAAVTGLIAYAAVLFGKGARLGWAPALLTAALLAALLLLRLHPILAILASALLGQLIVRRTAGRADDSTASERDR